MSERSQIPPSVIAKLRNYVYLYVNPITGQVFCVGKGKGSRALAHLNEAKNPAVAKTIEEIRSSGSAPLVLAGDFISTARGFPGYEPAGDRSLSALQYLLESHAYRTLPRGVAATADYTATTKNPRTVIDWVLVPEDWEILEYRVVPVPISDHFPVVLVARYRH